MMKTKKIFVSLVSLVFAASPLSTGVHADAGNFEPIMADAAWNYADYRVERLSFAPNAVGPMSVGPAVLVAEPTDATLMYHVSMLKNGMKQTWTNVPSEAFDVHTFAKNGNRLVYVQAADLSLPTYSLMERNLETGQPTMLVEGAFFQEPMSVSAMVDGTTYFFNPEYTFQNGFAQAGTEVWDETARKTKTVHPHWYAKTLRREELQDSLGGLALVNMVFEDASEQLWLMNVKDTDGNMSEKNITGTWTGAGNHIDAAHFRSDGSVEFFRNFVRYTYNPKTDTEAVRHEGEFLSWYRPVDRAYQISGDRMAWVNAEDTLFVSDLSGVTKIGTATEGQFLLDGDRLFYATGYGPTATGTIYNLKTKTSETLPFAVTDTFGDVVVGLDGLNQVHYLNQETGKGMTLGYGGAPVISDESHVYWKGKDGIYEATVIAAKRLSLNPVRALRVTGEAQVWLVKDGVRKAMPNPTTYFGWFPSWASVENVSSVELGRYPDTGIAHLPAGTKVKGSTSREVYVVGKDEKIHWIPSESVAYQLYGEFWNKNIVTMAPGDLFDYMVGNDILSEQDLQNS